jgi:hypothetical protein
MLRVLEHALRMKAQADSNNRVWKDFICRVFSWRKEKRKTAYWRMQGDLEIGDPVGLGGEWGFIAYLHCLMEEMPFRCKQAFPREEKCLFYLLWSLLHYCQRNAIKNEVPFFCLSD